MLAVIESAWPELRDYAIAHAFGDPHGPLTVGDKTVHYLPLEAIADDRARVVLFKSALTTGWDCPRARHRAGIRRGPDGADPDLLRAPLRDPSRPPLRRVPGRHVQVGLGSRRP